jgi:predicted hotdog family 3-hydroxylacyl-ACP dehydratase
MIATGEALLRLLPQRPPLLLLDALISCANDTTLSQFCVPADSVLVEDGHLSEAGLIENSAQTAAAGAGYGHQQAGAGAPPVGFIAAIKDLRVGALPAVGTVLSTEVVVQNRVLEFTIVRGTVRATGATFAECEMRIFIKDSE